ncbi:MAG TPA: AbrB/MazE/SpoVT family DNA-binding domain-containing protein [Thermomicrobiales bacterium]|nr:AbrB/MazE/SpoVT family DNA-binding domain-containing protein [Thermomicrobiales bacterium]
MATMQVRKRGQVTLPQVIRDAYRLHDGSELEVIPLDATRFEVRVLTPPGDLLALLDEFADAGPAPDLDAEREALAAALAAGDRP